MTSPLPGTPLQDGFHMPGDFEPHAGCWMLWPERPDNWHQGAKPAQRAFAKVAIAISAFEPVTMGASREQYTTARAILSPQVRVVELSSNDAWMRDCGPTFVVNAEGEVRGVDWGFNAWGGLRGGLYYPWDQDELVAQKVLEIEHILRYKALMVLEGGSILVDGEGTLITTEECLLNPNRNPNLNRSQIEEYLRQYTGAQKIIWMTRGVYQDETSGHIDNLLAFIRPGVVVLTWTDDPNDPQYEISREAYKRLLKETDARGRRLQIHKVHQPDPMYISGEESQGIMKVEGTLPRNPGDRLAASYVNFYVANGGVIVPQFNSPYDQPALELLSQLFPERKVVGVQSREILLGGGNIHCITLGQPQKRIP